MTVIFLLPNTDRLQQVEDYVRGFLMITELLKDFMAEDGCQVMIKHHITSH
jgi:hypothetical protein